MASQTNFCLSVIELYTSSTVSSSSRSSECLTTSVSSSRRRLSPVQINAVEPSLSLCSKTSSIIAPGLAPARTKLTSLMSPRLTSRPTFVSWLARIDIETTSPCLTISFASIPLDVPLK